MKKTVEVPLGVALLIGFGAFFLYLFHGALLLQSPQVGSSPRVVVLSNSSFLRPGDEFIVRISTEEENSAEKYYLRVEPSEIFSIIGRHSREASTEFIVEVRETEKRGLVSGKVLVFKEAVQLLEVPFCVFIGFRQPEIYSSGALIELEDESGNLKLWVWEVGIPYGLPSRPFFTPMLENFTLMREYLNLQLYVGSVVPRQGGWWPLRGFGPQNFQIKLEEVLLVKPYGSYVLVNVTRIPESAKGATVAISGATRIRGLSEKSGTLKLILGFLDKPSIYIVVPVNINITSTSVAGEEKSISPCIYAPPKYKCYLLKVPNAILSPFELELVLSRL